MAGDWAFAFLSSIGVTCLGSLVLCRGAAAASHHRTGCAKRIAGLGLATGTVLGGGLEDQAPEGMVIVLAVGVFGGLGVLSDRHRFSRGARALVLLAMAVVVVVSGLRLSATDVLAVDIGLTVLWIVAISNAFASIGNIDGLVGGLGATGATCVLVLAILGGQASRAAAAAAMAGAFLGFLPFGTPWRSTRRRDTGSSLFGFTLAVLTIDADTSLAEPAAVVVAVLLVAVPLLETTVTIDRLRRRRPLTGGGRDHLPHRLVARGLSPGAAIAMLVLAGMVEGGLAVAAGRRVVPLWVASAVVVTVVGALAVVTTGAPVHDGAVGGWPRWLRPAALLAVVAVLLLAGPAAVAMFRAQSDVRAGGDLARRGLKLLGDGQQGEALTALRKAGTSLRRARELLDSPVASLGLAVPGVSSNLKASRTLVSTSERLTRAGARLTTIAEAGQLQVRRGSVPLDRIRGLAPALASATGVLEDSLGRLRRVDRQFLVPPLRTAVDDLASRLARESVSASTAAEAARLAPAILGGTGTRRYFLAFQNNAELRGTGGFLGNWGELTAAQGRLRLTRSGRLSELIEQAERPRRLDVPKGLLNRYQGFDVGGSWTQVNASPDFPTTARLIAQLYPQSGGRPVDGVIAVDPIGLGALLSLTGPVAVPGWPEPITAGNVVDVTLRAAYEQYDAEDERAAFLVDLSRRVFEAFTSADLGSPAAVARAFGEAVRTDHLMMYLDDPDEQRLVSRLGIDGFVPAVRGDTITVVDQNLSANKVDFYLHRRLRYEIVLDPSSHPATLTGQLEVALHNRAPSGGLSYGVIGPYDERFQPGENRTYLSVYSPFTARWATLDGAPTPLDSQPELDRLAHSMVVSVPAMQSRTVRLGLEGQIDLGGGAWYRLDLGHQPVVNPDEVEVSVAVPKGWRITGSRGLERTGGRRAEGTLTLVGERSLLVKVEPNRWSGLWEQLTSG